MHNSGIITTLMMEIKKKLEDLVDSFNFDADFNVESNRVFNKQNVLIVDNHTPEIMEDNSLQKELTTLRKYCSPDF